MAELGRYYVGIMRKVWKTTVIPLSVAAKEYLPFEVDEQKDISNRNNEDENYEYIDEHARYHKVDTSQE